MRPFKNWTDNIQRRQTIPVKEPAKCWLERGKSAAARRSTSSDLFKFHGFLD
jgi:hypothetical protein